MAVLASPVAAGRLGRLLDLGMRRLGRESDLERVLVELQQGCIRVVRASWPRLTLGVGLYAASLGLLLGSCLWLTGAGVTPVVVIVGLAVERMLTLAGLTPGGAGIVELGLTGVLLVLGGDPAGVVAGVLLYRAITFGLEIPVGGAGVAAWLWTRRRAGELVEETEAELRRPHEAGAARDRRLPPASGRHRGPRVRPGREQRDRGIEAEVATISPAGPAEEPAYVHRLAGGPVGPRAG